MPSESEVAAYKKALANHEAGEYKPGEFVSPGAGSTGGRKKVSKEKFNNTSERYGSCDDWLTPTQRPGSPTKQKRSWTPKDPKLKNLSLFEM